MRRASFSSPRGIAFALETGALSRNVNIEKERKRYSLSVDSVSGTVLSASHVLFFIGHKAREALVMHHIRLPVLEPDCWIQTSAPPFTSGVLLGELI